MLVVCLPAASARAQNPAITISVDVSANRHPINPNVYGVAHATTAQLNDLNTPINRNGGNNTTRYNWQLNADNRGSDWYFESIADSSATAGERGDSFFANSRAANAQPMLTIPMVDWVAKVGPSRSKLAGFSIAKYGAQTGNDWQWFADAGNGIRSNGQNVTGNDPNDANVPSTSVFQQGWVQHLVARWGTQANGGLRYYILDNEPSLWHSTHRDVHPVGATMDEMRDRMIDYASKIKAVDSTALVAGPEEWGWSGYLLSGYDQQYGGVHGWSVMPDRNNHGGSDYLPWLLGALRQHDAGTGVRLLDIFTVHYYPQGGEFSDDVSSAMQLRRNRSTRSLWDPAYVDESWIGDRVQLIPRLKGWAATYYPGTAIGITEYNWGAENHINGATAQADILGIFGREGLDIGARWTTPASSTAITTAAGRRSATRASRP
jgi:Glycoside hydrolase family 44